MRARQTRHVLSDAPAVRPGNMVRGRIQLHRRRLRAGRFQHPLEVSAGIIAEAEAEFMRDTGFVLLNVDVLPDTALALREILRVAEGKIDGVNAMVHAHSANDGRGPAE